MDDATLVATIQGDPQALSLANLGRDDDCARRVNALPAAKEIVSTIIYEKDIVDAAAAVASGVGTAKLDAGVALLQKLKTLTTAATTATGRNTATYVVNQLSPMANGWDVGTDWAQKYLNGIAAASQTADIPLTIAEKNLIANLANQARISGADVTRVWAQFRVGGKVA